MLPEPVIIDPADISNSVDGPVVPVVLMLPAVPLVLVDVGQDVDEFFLCVRYVPQQFVIEA